MPRAHITTLHIDGKSYSDDELARSSDQEMRDLPIIVVTEEGLKANAAFAFSTDKGLEDWAARNRLGTTYDKILKKIDTAFGTSPRDEVRLAKEQQAQVEEDTKRVLEILKQNGVATNDAEGLHRLAKAGKLGHSYVLNRYPDYEGRMKYFSGPAAYPSYKWMDFNNMASSARHWGPATLLFQTTWFRDRKIMLIGDIDVRHLGDYPFYFNNMASSSCGI